MKNITVIGAGTMGNGIAHVFAQSGFAVNLVDVSQDSLERGLKTIAGNLERMIAKEKITEADKTATLNNITTFTDTAEAVKNADLVVETLFDLGDKLNVFPEKNPIDPLFTSKEIRFFPKWNFKIVYRIEENRILIIAVLL